MNNEERKRRILKVIILVFAILSLNNIILLIKEHSYAFFEKNVKTGVKLKITTRDKMPRTGPMIDWLKSDIESSSCNPIVTDDNGTLDESDDTIYFSGTNDCVNFNYVWYSGKLWRIVAINSDGSMKLVTQDAITSIYWGADAKNYKGSWIYQWLNEDFKDTLYNYQDITVQNADWNVTATASGSVRPPTDESATIVQGDVGLLNAYEYAQAYKNASASTNYLNIGYAWWLINPYNGFSGSDIWFVDSKDGDLEDRYSPSSHMSAVRPSINLKSNIGIVAGGDGSQENPYRINGDELGNSGELINTRVSGEYVKVDNKVYRIVGIENETTKLTSVDYVRGTGGAVLTKNFGSNSNWGDSVASENNDYWGYYLNNTWLTSELQKYITEGTYYLGRVGDEKNYKNTICNESDTTERTSSCKKTSSIWTGLVGLPRVGEMFSVQLDSYSSSSSSIWLITPFRGSSTYCVGSSGGIISDLSSSYAYGVRPSINLKSEVKITGGDGMSPKSAYTIGL